MQHEWTTTDCHPTNHRNTHRLSLLTDMAVKLVSAALFAFGATALGSAAALMSVSALALLVGRFHRASAAMHQAAEALDGLQGDAFGDVPSHRRITATRLMPSEPAEPAASVRRTFAGRPSRGFRRMHRASLPQTSVQINRCVATAC